MQIETKFSIKDKLFYFQRSVKGDLMGIFPVTIESIVIEADKVRYHCENGYNGDEKSFFTHSQCLDEIRKLERPQEEVDGRN